MNNQEYIEKWLNGTLSEEDMLIFEKTDEFKSIDRLLKAVMYFKAPEYNVNDELQRLKRVKTSIKEEKVIAISWLKPLLRVAAVLILMAGAYFVFLSNPATKVVTMAGEKTEVILPDSSSVRMNATSAVTYYTRTWEKRRRLILAGEAFFNVAKGSRFDVETDAGTVTVLGTQFNVKSRKGYFEVVCYEGLVEVSSAERLIQLSPSKMLRVVNGTITTNEKTSEASPSWVHNESSFESVPFVEVLNEFERQYNITITTKNVDLNQLFTGRFVHTDLTLALKSISIPLNLKFEVNSKNVVLSGEDQ